MGQDVADGVEDVEEMFGDGLTQEETLENSTEVTDKAVTARKWCAQKIGTHDLVEVAQRTSLHQCPGNSMPDSAKGNIAGIGKVKDWAEKLSSSKAVCSPRVSASSTSHSHASSLLNATSFGVKGSTRSTHSSATQPPPTPASVSSRVVPVSYLGEDSELADFRNYTQEGISKGSNASTRADMEGHQSAAPLSKHTKTKAEDGVIKLPNCPRNNMSSKFTNQDLPPGCQDGNVWHSIYIPSLAHWCGGYVNPWTIEAGDLQDAMQMIWDEVYHGKVEHYIAPRGPVFHVVCWALTLAAHGNLQLEKLVSGSKPQKHAVLLKGDSGVTWEVIIPDGKPYGFNFQTWGETMRKLLQPIMMLSNANFSTIVEETQCYVKVSTKGKERSTGSSGSNEDDDDDFQNLFEFQ
ncbi:hypothetical protein BKA82DRAFT_9545 [Pisolithus tinctorius]|uniref:Uncharacterized protein n=1 Tax=Pisolithus tinctorius Marx 270 TaxID=870435 RepID=A0A0C3P6I6_PISTI|nr:hypothetical protein BKA82DRAFT_9545 [Pisolithus tinctorius]KIO03186.1 hypothetical protein M404DRAFT_9545 [Pisolithus tinctorius Marx 270]